MKEDAVRNEWPRDGLERVLNCPVCSSRNRTLLFDGLRDRIFFSPGEWTMFRCRDCQSAYLDPRPTQNTIGIAYQVYHTHDAVRPTPTERLTLQKKLGRALANGYRNRRFRAHLQPSSNFGALAMMVVPGMRSLLERRHRHLPKESKGRLLDVGFGDGAFLIDAAAIGWDAVGTDIDPAVIEAARARGLNVTCGTVDEVKGPFDYITLAHTIEHFHEPVRVLRRCHELLAPGGKIWIETPNADARGLRRFGRDWRGLEPPRHLVLFTRNSLRGALEREGFSDIRNFAQPYGLVKALYGMSENIRLRKAPEAKPALPARLKAEIVAASAANQFSSASHEFLGMIATKGSSI